MDHIVCFAKRFNTLSEQGSTLETTLDTAHLVQASLEENMDEFERFEKVIKHLRTLRTSVHLNNELD